jgi:hypothetical protein
MPQPGGNLERLGQQPFSNTPNANRRASLQG